MSDFFKLCSAVSLGWIVPLMAGSASDISLATVYDLSPEYLAGELSVIPIGIVGAVQSVVDNSGDGGTSAKMGGVGLLADGEMAGIECKAMGPGVLAFDWKVSSAVDLNTLSFYEVGDAVTNRISGTTGGWNRVHMTVNSVPDTVHTFRWGYEKNPAGGAVGDDCGWVDAISWSPFYKLTVNDGSGEGAFTNGTVVTIMADVPPQWQMFDRWTGDTNGVANVTSASTTIKMPGAAAAVSATYKAILYAVAVSGGTGGGSYTNGSAVSIHAGAAPAYFVFDRWTGNTNGVACVTSADTVLTVLGAGASVTATYRAILYELSVTGGTGAGTYTNGAIIAIGAGAAPAYFVFDRWTGDTNGVANVTSASTTIKMPGAAAAVSATYKAILYAVAVSGGTGGGSYTNGSAVSIHAGAAPAYFVFDRWTGNTNGVACVTSADTVLTVLSAGVSVTATYRAILYELSVTGGTGAGTYTNGAIVAIRAGAAPAYFVFDRWAGATQYVSGVTAAIAAVSMPATNISVAAAYRLNPVSQAVGCPVAPLGALGAVQTSSEQSGDGGTSVKLGGVGLLADGEMAGLECTTPGAGVLAFDWKVSSEAGWDVLRFYEVGSGATNEISGTTGGWNRVYTTINSAPDAVHTFRWEYVKDPAGDYVGQDCGWVDAIRWSPCYTLTVNGGAGDGALTNGTVVTITADAPPQWQRFDRWTGDTNGIANVLAASTTLVMPATGIVVTATYTPILYTFAVANGSGGGSYTYGSTIEIGATPYTGKRFYRWTGDVERVANVAAATTTVFTTGQSVSVAATYSVQLGVNYGTGSGWYPEGSTATVTADPDPLWKEFATWTGDGAGLLGDAAARTTMLAMPTGPRLLTATYRDSVARVAGCYGRTFTVSGNAGGVTTDFDASSPSGTPAIKLGGAGVVPDNGFALFETVVSGSGTVTFWWKVSSEIDADYLKFRVDGVLIAAISGTKGPWAQVSYRVEGAGVSHILRWGYGKNGSLASSIDAGWVDDIVWNGDVPEPVIAPDIHAVAAADGLFGIGFLGERGIPYTVYSNATLEATGWAPMAVVPLNMGETNGLFLFESNIVPPVGQPTGFYRVLTP